MNTFFSPQVLIITHTFKENPDKRGAVILEGNSGVQQATR
jgi:hypothetical protein